MSEDIYATYSREEDGTPIFHFSGYMKFKTDEDREAFVEDFRQILKKPKGFKK